MRSPAFNPSASTTLSFASTEPGASLQLAAVISLTASAPDIFSAGPRAFLVSRTARLNLPIHAYTFGYVVGEKVSAGRAPGISVSQWYGQIASMSATRGPSVPKTHSLPSASKSCSSRLNAFFISRIASGLPLPIESLVRRPFMKSPLSFRNAESLSKGSSAGRSEKA